METIDALLRDLFTTGEFAKFLIDRGWAVQTPIPQNVSADDLTFKVPMMMQRDPYAHA